MRTMLLTLTILAGATVAIATRAEAAPRATLLPTYSEAAPVQTIQYERREFRRREMERRRRAEWRRRHRR